MRKTTFGLSVGILASAFAGQVGAQNYTSGDAQSPWHVGLAAVYVDKPYDGYDSDEKTVLVPLVLKFGKRWFIAGNHGGFRLLPDSNDFDLDIIGRVNTMGYESSDSSTLTGMSDRDPAFEAGVMGKYSPGKWGVSAYWVHDVSDEYDGSEAFGEIFYLGKNGPWTAKYSAGAYWRSEDLIDHYFGVTSSEATPSRPAYAPDDEVHGFLGGTIAYDFQAPVSLWVHVNWQFFDDEVEDSPIVSEDKQMTALVGLTYRF